MTHELWGVISALLVNALGWVLHNITSRRENREARENQLVRNFQILQDRYGFDFTEHGAGGGKARAAAANAGVLSGLGDGAGNDSPRKVSSSVPDL